MTVEVRFVGQNRIEAKGYVDVEQVKGSVPASGSWSPLSFLSGQVPIELSARLVNQDGFGSGGLASVNVDPSGILSATFDNGQSRALFQVAVARFGAPEGLAPSGNQLYRATVEVEVTSGEVVTATGRGTFVAVKPGHPAYDRW